MYLFQTIQIKISLYLRLFLRGGSVQGRGEIADDAVAVKVFPDENLAGILRTFHPLAVDHRRGGNLHGLGPAGILDDCHGAEVIEGTSPLTEFDVVEKADGIVAEAGEEPAMAAFHQILHPYRQSFGERNPGTPSRSRFHWNCGPAP